MSIQEDYDAIVIGSGEAGKYMAWHLASKGQRVANVEDKQIGGACPNVACLPSKNIIHSAKVVSYFQRGSEFGLQQSDTRIDMSAINARRKQMVDELREVHLANYEKSHAELIMGFGRFVSEKSVQVALNAGGVRTLSSNRIFLDTGSRAAMNLVTGLVESRPLTHVEALELEMVPEHLLILGGGHVGLEFAQAMRRFGARVTVIERGHALAQWEDPDVSDGVTKLFQDEGIEVLTSSTATRVEGISGKSVTLSIQHGDAERSIRGSHLLVATGRTPNTENMGLEVAGIKTTPSDHIQVNERLETSIPGVWAMGDCAGSPRFTHISYDDFRIVRDNLDGGVRSTAGRQVPSCMFIDPELARVGLSETEAGQRGLSYRLAKIPMRAVLRTRTLNETRGFLKALISDDDRILGFTAFGVGSGDLLPVVQLAMTAGLPYTAISSLVIAHPTFSEGLQGLFSAVPPRPK